MATFDFGSSDLKQWVYFIIGSVINLIIYAVCSPVITIVIMAAFMFVPQAQNIVVAVKEHSFEPLRVQMKMSPLSFYSMVIKNNAIIFINCIIISVYGAVQMHWGWQVVQAAHMMLHAAPVVA